MPRIGIVALFAIAPVVHAERFFPLLEDALRNGPHASRILPASAETKQAGLNVVSVPPAANAEPARSKPEAWSSADTAATIDLLNHEQSSATGASEPHLDRALQLQGQGLYIEADVEYQAALCDAERFGPDHLGVAHIYIHLGRLRTLQHKYSEALTAFERSLGIVEKSSESDNLEAGLIVGNIAMIHHAEGHYRIAESLYRRAITILTRDLQPRDVRTVTIKTGLAKLMLAQRRYEEGEALFEETIPVLETAQPLNHTNLAISLINLAEAYRADGRYSRAEPLYRSVLAMVEGKPELKFAEIMLGLDHFPAMLREMKRKVEAQELEIQIRKLTPT